MPGVTMHLKVWKDIENAAIEGVHDAADVIADEARRLIRETEKTGRVYNGHRASAPGEPYANETGLTISQIRVEKTADRGRVIFGGENAIRMEYGTEIMEPRPVATPAFRNVQKQVNEAAGYRIRRYLSRNAK